jgi:hypothetical protein
MLPGTRAGAPDGKDLFVLHMEKFEIREYLIAPSDTIIGRINTDCSTSDATLRQQKMPNVNPESVADGEIHSWRDGLDVFLRRLLFTPLRAKRTKAGYFHWQRHLPMKRCGGKARNTFFGSVSV